MTKSLISITVMAVSGSYGVPETNLIMGFGVPPFKYFVCGKFTILESKYNFESLNIHNGLYCIQAKRNSDLFYEHFGTLKLKFGRNDSEYKKAL